MMCVLTVHLTGSRIAGERVGMPMGVILIIVVSVRRPNLMGSGTKNLVGDSRL